MQQEFILSKNKQLYWVRFKEHSLWSLFFFAVVLTWLFRKDVHKIFYYLVPFLIFWIADIILTPSKVLSRVVFDQQTRQVTVETLNFNKKHQYIIPFDTAQIVMRQYFFWSRHSTPWVLKIYEKNKLIYKQRQDRGWTAEQLFEIKKAAKFFTSST